MMLAINRALQNWKVIKKLKTGLLKKEIIYFCSAKSKTEHCQKLHNIINDNPSCYLLFIDSTKDDIKNIKEILGGNEVNPSNYEKFLSYDKIIKEFEISEEELENDMGIMGAVYNRIATKDLK
jgi:hypothetical protein